MRATMFGFLTMSVLFLIAGLSSYIGHTSVGFVGVGLAVMTFSILNMAYQLRAAKPSMAETDIAEKGNSPKKYNSVVRNART